MLNIESQLNSFRGISLAEMDSVRLMDRVDTKFAISMDELPGLLEKLKELYSVVDINGLRLPSYESMYFDDDNFTFYKAHHNGREERFKVRIRNYVESGLFFLEVKHRLKGRVIKKRIQLSGFEKELSESSKKFVDAIVRENGPLHASMMNSYKRITLVDVVREERLTIDIDLKFTWEGKTNRFDNLVILELKQKRFDRHGQFNQIMRKMNKRPYRLSKYCIGSLSLYKGKIKHNMFKEKMLQIDKIGKLYE
jgi:VTC domain